MIVSGKKKLGRRSVKEAKTRLGSRSPDVVLIDHLLSNDLKLSERSSSKLRRDRDVGGVSAARNHDAPNAGHIVPGIECVPSAIQEDLEPGAKIHWRRILRYTNIAGIARAIARRDVHATA